MTVKEFKIWLIDNEFNQRSLAKKLGTTEQTISRYVRSERFPKMFIYSLKHLENNQNIN